MNLMGDCDAEDLIAKLLAEGDYAAVASILTQLAVARAARMPVHPVNCGCPHCNRRRLDHQLRLNRRWQEALEAVVTA
ncbi:hypothetical protein [Streptomyces syringium]|uniref:hypothetical protein n=1 Tax=Streptomyces syringium TaxID=76729 RepID=UPI003453AF5B